MVDGWWLYGTCSRSTCGERPEEFACARARCDDGDEEGAAARVVHEKGVKGKRFFSSYTRVLRRCRDTREVG